ncbi:MAG: ferritin family protein [bacterium]
MTIRFSAAEMLQVAEQIEHNGVTFYQVAAGQVDNNDAHALLVRLSNWEENHAALFAAMRTSLSAVEQAETAYDPYDEMLLYLRAFADGVVFTDDPQKLFGTVKTKREILKIALERERDSIIFYTGMRQYVPQALGLDKLDHVIKEEFSHVVLLEKELAKRTT